VNPAVLPPSVLVKAPKWQNGPPFVMRHGCARAYGSVVKQKPARKRVRKVRYTRQDIGEMAWVLS
jgi:hypothetical protein